MRFPWWARFTRWRRFDARHRDCQVRQSNGSNWCGYYTVWECAEPLGTRSWGHHQYRCGVSYPELGIPARYSSRDDLW